MARVQVETVIDVAPDVVWSAIEDVSDHVNWMADANAIRFRTAQRTGVGTTFDCETRVGPLRTTDRMTITEWDPGRAMGVRHEGVVTGEGRFTLTPAGEGRTSFAWDEELRFPVWLGGAAAGAAARPVLGAIWRGNLRRLKAWVEQGVAAG